MYENIKKDFIDKVTDKVKGTTHLKYTLGISHKGKREYYVIGEDGMEDSMLFHYEIGSITKIFTGLLVARAVGEGKISLEDTIDKFIDELAVASNMPTIKNLLIHKSGFEYNPSDEEGEDYLPKENPFLHITKSDVIDEILNERLEDRGYPFCYSNLGAATLGIILDQVYNKPYVTLLDELIKEIGLNETYAVNPPYDIEGLRDDGRLDGHWEWLATSVYSAAGCLVSNAEDMLKFGEYLFKQEKDYVKIALEILDVNDMGDYTQGIGFLTFNYPDYSMYFHDGGTGCFNSTLCIQYDKQVVTIALSNAYHEIISHTFRFARQLAQSL